jgi:hypothetical protein
MGTKTARHKLLAAHYAHFLRSNCCDEFRQEGEALCLSSLLI